jgi:hypothetical protein
MQGGGEHASGGRERWSARTRSAAAEPTTTGGLDVIVSGMI